MQCHTHLLLVFVVLGASTAIYILYWRMLPSALGRSRCSENKLGVALRLGGGGGGGGGGAEVQVKTMDADINM